jgi:peptidoglycan biosynthesis protein MviN/MurJ (putative lipid II flippase)
MAYFVGGGYLNDAFNGAYNIPNLLRRLFGEGALSTAFVPIYNEIGIKADNKRQIEFALNVLSILTLFLLLITFIGIIFAPQIVSLLYPGLAPETAEIAIKHLDNVSLSLLHRFILHFYRDTKFPRVFLYDRAFQRTTEYRDDALYIDPAFYSAFTG